MNQNNWLPMRLLDLSKFDWDNKNDPAKSNLVAEASILGIAPGDEFIQRMYNDSCDVGIAIKSPKTDKVYRFFLQQIDSTIENEIQRWIFKPEDKNCPIVKVTIFND